MSDVSGVTGQRHFSGEDEMMLRGSESTNSIVKRDTKTTVDIYGADFTWPEIKEHQQSLSHNKAGVVEVGVTMTEGAEIAGVVSKIEHMAAATRGAGAVEGAAFGAGVLAPVVALGAGTYGLGEAHVKADEQARALAKDEAHVALIGALDLPESYKAARFEGSYKHVELGFQSRVFRALEGLKADPRGLAKLQLHADRGMHAARDLLASGMSAADFVKTNPKVIESFIKDAAFREGFQGYLHAKATLPKSEMKAFEARLHERDGWYSQSEIRVRV